MKNLQAKLFIQNNLSFHDCVINKIEFTRKSNKLDIKVLLANTIGIEYVILFIDVIEVSFFYTNDYTFYVITEVKFINEDDSFYLSFDPDETNSSRVETDQDYIHCKEIEIYANAKSS